MADHQEPFSPSDPECSMAAQARALRREASLFQLPQGLERMNRLLIAAPVDLKKLEQAAQDELELVLDMLKLCNSSFFRLPCPVARLEQAVMMMDADVTRALLLACWLIKDSRDKVGARQHQIFWRHNLLVAQLSRHISEWAGWTQPEWAFLAGLFHDIGALPILILLSRDSAGADDGIFEEIGDSVEPQRRRFGIDHCELGRQMGATLDLPHLAVEAAAGHHVRGGLPPGMPVVSFVSAAELVSQSGSRTVSAQASSSERQAILDVLIEYLPGLSRFTLSGLAEILGSDLAGALPRLEPAETHEETFCSDRG